MRRISKSRYLAVFSITTLIFIIGIILGNFSATTKLKHIDYLGQELKTDTVAMEIQYEIIADDPCSHVNSTPLAEDLYEIASKLDYMENRLGEDNKDVQDLKEYYSLLEIRHWMFLKKTKKECKNNRTLVLYFYSNKKDCHNCEEQGFILTWIRKNYPHVYIYAFDYNIENAALDTIKEIYNINGTPSIVVDSKTNNRFVPKWEMENIIKETMKNQTISEKTPVLLN